MSLLDGVRVLTLEHYGAGPYGTGLLADLGADVIKVENPATGGDVARTTGPYFLGDGDSLYYQSFSRGKRSVAIDLRSEAGRDRFERSREGCRCGGEQPARRPAGEASHPLRRPRRGEPGDRLRPRFRLRAGTTRGRTGRDSTT